MGDRREAPAFAAFASHAHQLVSNEELLHDSGPLDDAVTSSVVKIQAWWRGYAAMARVERDVVFASHGQQSATDKLDRALGQAECDALAAHVSTYGPPLSQQVAEELRARVALLSEEIQLQDVSGLLSEIADSAHIDSKHQECAGSQIQLMQAMLWPISHRKYGKITKYVDRREAPAFAAFASHAHQLVLNEELLHESGPLDDAVTSPVVKFRGTLPTVAAESEVLAADSAPGTTAALICTRNVLCDPQAQVESSKSSVVVMAVSPILALSSYWPSPDQSSLKEDNVGGSDNELTFCCCVLL